MKTANHTRKFFYLKETKSSGINKGKSLIMLSYFCQDRRRFKISTRIYINKKFWSDAGQRVIPSTSGATELNITLDKFVSTITGIVAQLKADGVTTTPEAIQERYKELTIERVQERHDRLFTPFLIEALGTKENPGRLRRKLKGNTVKSYKTLLKQIEEEERRRGLPLSFESFTTKFFIDFSEQLSKKLGANTIHKHFSQIKSLLRLAVREGRTEFRGFEDAKIDLKKTEPVTVYLSEVELERICQLKNSSEIAERDDAELILREADRIVLGCWLGLRWSDFSKVANENIYENAGKWFLTIGTQKTDETVILPLHVKALEILNKYDRSFPKISQQKANLHIKKVCELAKINDPVPTPRGMCPKFEEVSTHTMRRSFATNLIRLGVPHFHVMKLGGWKSLSSFERYIRLSKEDSAERVAEIFAGNTSPMLKLAV